MMTKMQEEGKNDVPKKMATATETKGHILQLHGCKLATCEVAKMTQEEIRNGKSDMKNGWKLAKNSKSNNMTHPTCL